MKAYCGYATHEKIYPSVRHSWILSIRLYALLKAYRSKRVNCSNPNLAVLYSLIKNCSVDVKVTRIGGGFGGKYQYPPLVAAATAVAAKALDRYSFFIGILFLYKQ